MSTVRCCSRCRCPGHTAKNCNVFKPASLTYYEPSGPGDLERAEVRGIIKEIRRIHALGKPAMTEYECIRAWIAKGNDSSRLSSARMDCARRCHESDRAKILGIRTMVARTGVVLPGHDQLPATPAPVVEPRQIQVRGCCSGDDVCHLRGEPHRL